MILTLTPNPSIDRTITLAGELARGQVQRVVSVTSQAGGKGVNISRASVSAGEPTLAVLPAAKDDPFVHRAARGRHRLPPGPPGGRGARQRHDHRARRHHHQAQLPRRHGRRPSTSRRWPRTLLARAPGASWTVLAGSLPAGAPPEFYADLVRRLRDCGAKVAVDTSEAPLQALVDALPGSAPDLMKPNGEELASFTGGDADALESDPAAGRRSPRAPWSIAASAPCWRRWAATAPCS